MRECLYTGELRVYIETAFCNKHTLQMSLKEIAHKNIQMVFVRRFNMTYIFSLETFYDMNIQKVFSP
jgi:hypothetical protein